MWNNTLKKWFAHPVTLEPEVTGGWYSGLWTLIECTLCVLSMKTVGSDSFFECVISHGMTLIFIILGNRYSCFAKPSGCFRWKYY